MATMLLMEQAMISAWSGRLVDADAGQAVQSVRFMIIWNTNVVRTKNCLCNCTWL